MKNEKQLWWLYLVVLATYLAAVSILTFSVPHLSYPQSYLNIIKAGKLELGSRIVVNSLLNGFGAFAGLILRTSSVDLIYKTFSILASSLIVLVSGIMAYKISGKIAKTLFSTMVLLGSPAIFLLTFNTVFTETVALLFFLLTFLLWETSLKGRKKFILASIMMSVSIFATPLSAVLLLIYGLYFIMQKVEGRQIMAEELETYFFSVLLFIGYYTFMLRDLLVGSYARKAVSDLITPFFHSLVNFNYLMIVPVVGIIPLLIGIYCIYSEITKEKKSQKEVYLMSSAASVSFLLIFSSAVNIYFLFALLSVSLSIISALFITNLNSFLRKSTLKLSAQKFFLLAVISANVIFAVLYVPEAISENIRNSPSSETIRFIIGISEEFPEKRLISSLEAVPAIINFGASSAFEAWILDGQEKDIQEKIKKSYLSPFESQMVQLMNSTRADCIIFTEYEKKAFNTSSLRAIDPFRVNLEKNVSGNLLYCLKQPEDGETQK